MIYDDEIFETIQLENDRITDAVDNRFLDCSIVGMAWNAVEITQNIMLPFSSFENCILKHNLFACFKMKKFDFEDCDLQESCFCRAG